MKVVLNVLISGFIFAQSASAASVIAKVSSTGGFNPNPYYSSQVIILDNGSVIWVRQEGTPQYKKQVLATLSQTRTAALVKEINQITPAELIDENLGAPQCMDAPVTSYMVVNSQNNSEIQIGKDYNCHKFSLKNGDGSLVVDILDGLRKLSYLGVN
jgi:hypothetical protein